ncbi:MAG: thioesterase family protein, partial [Candidatus Eremiobacteraeota bacterium]|nr:thioesterase family protein [Candidatus Eremiobacteraeota bacterium]
IDFRAPARFDDPLQLLTWVRAVGTSSVRFEVVVRRPTDDTLLARARVVTVCVDRRTERSRPLPELVATVLRRNVEAA